LYIPNHEKWMKFYDSLGVSEHPTFFVKGARTKAQTGGSIGKTGEVSIVPIETRPQSLQKPAKDNTEVKVEFVSPAQQTVEQAASEIKRENNIKGKRSRSNTQSSKSLKKKRKTTKCKHDGNQF